MLALPRSTIYNIYSTCNAAVSSTLSTINIKQMHIMRDVHVSTSISINTLYSGNIIRYAYNTHKQLDL